MKVVLNLVKNKRKSALIRHVEVG